MAESKDVREDVPTETEASAGADAAAEGSEAGGQGGGDAEKAQDAGDESRSLEEMAAALEQAELQAEALTEKLLRTQAEMENVRRRVERDLENAHKYALERFANELLPVRDSLEMGASAASQQGVELDKIKEGVDLTLKILSGVLEKFGIKELNPVQEPFNPELHQAMSVQESDEHGPDTVLAVYQKGYTLNDRLLRPAMVVVSKSGSGGGEKIDETA